MPGDSSPVWLIAKALILFAFVALFSVINCSDLDETEMWMLGEVSVVFFGATAAEVFIKKTQR